MAMEDPQLIEDVPIETSIYIANFDSRREKRLFPTSVAQLVAPRLGLPSFGGCQAKIRSRLGAGGWSISTGTTAGELCPDVEKCASQKMTL
jgi:hypothetical protein